MLSVGRSFALCELKRMGERARIPLLCLNDDDRYNTRCLMLR